MSYFYISRSVSASGFILIYYNRYNLIPIYRLSVTMYALYIDEDRKVNAMKFESSFYNIKADLRSVQAPKEEQPALDVSAFIEQLQKSPEPLQTLSQLITAKT